MQTQRLKFKRLPQGQRHVGWRYRHGDRRLEPAVGTVLRVWLAMEAAVGERPAEALVEEQEEQGRLYAFLREAVGGA